MWARDEARPTPYGGRMFRSALEAKAAEQFDALGVTWEYEVKPHVALSWFTPSYKPDPPNLVGYLPDFTIVQAADDLELPLWVEVKPAGLLYAVRDHLGCRERFTDDFGSGINAAQMQAAGLDEIWKPKRLAEFYDREVLVVSEINRNRTLSILMTAYDVTLSRRHPTVNHRQVVLDAERAEREARWRAEQEVAAARRQQEQAEQLAAWVQHFRQAGRPARFDGWCIACGTTQPAAAIVIARDSAGGWRSLCKSHLADPRGGPA